MRTRYDSRSIVLYLNTLIHDNGFNMMDLMGALGVIDLIQPLLVS